MTKNEQVANIIAFLTILFGVDDEMESIMKFSPDYIIEKFYRYILSDSIEYPWGLHPSLKRGIFQRYVDKWHLQLEEIQD
jgi:hypothetical protein